MGYLIGFSGNFEKFQMEDVFINILSIFFFA